MSPRVLGSEQPHPMHTVKAGTRRGSRPADLSETGQSDPHLGPFISPVCAAHLCTEKAVEPHPAVCFRYNQIQWRPCRRRRLHDAQPSGSHRPHTTPRTPEPEPRDWSPLAAGDTGGCIRLLPVCKNNYCLFWLWSSFGERCLVFGG